MTTYKILRFYQDENVLSQTVSTGLTLEEAQAHCNDPETSSSTCTSAVGRKRTERYGPWFDGYEAEKPTRSYVIDTFDGESQR